MQNNSTHAFFVILGESCLLQDEYLKVILQNMPTLDNLAFIFILHFYLLALHKSGSPKHSFPFPSSSLPQSAGKRGSLPSDRRAFMVLPPNRPLNPLVTGRNKFWIGRNRSLKKFPNCAFDGFTQQRVTITDSKRTVLGMFIVSQLVSD